MKICDLHTHSNYSDGTLTPTELLNLAVDLGLSAIALCDHNTIDGVKEFKDAAKGKPIEAVAGTEITTEYNGIELHILGIAIPDESLSLVDGFCASLNKRKREANRKMIAALNAAGYEVDYDKLVSYTAQGQINRAHVASELVKNGYCETVRDAFKTLLRDGGEFYKSPKREDSFETIAFLRKIGAVPVIAHPFFSTTPENLTEFWPKAKSAGLVGMETLYPMYDEKTTVLAKETAEKYGFSHSGGSDFHGENKPYITLGSGRGDLAVPYEFYEKLINSKNTLK